MFKIYIYDKFNKAIKVDSQQEQQFPSPLKSSPSSESSFSSLPKNVPTTYSAQSQIGSQIGFQTPFKQKQEINIPPVPPTQNKQIPSTKEITVTPGMNNVGIHEHYQNFQNRNQNWIPEVPEELKNQPTMNLYQHIAKPENHQEHVFNFGQFSKFSPEPEQLGQTKIIGYLQPQKKESSGNRTMGDLMYTLEYGRHGEYAKTANPEERGHSLSWDGYNRNHPVLNLYYDLMDMAPESRGENYMAQQSTRFEDLIRRMTEHLSPEEKQNITTSLNASLDVGKYYHATQGYRYKDNRSRKQHLGNLKQDILNNIEKPYIYPKNAYQIEKQPPRDQNGNPVSLLDLGYKEEDLNRIINTLQQAENENTLTHPEFNPNTEEHIEPWDVLMMEPENSPPIWLKTEENDLIKTNLMKYLMLNDGSWDGIKRIHPVTEKDRQGHEFTEHMRAKQMARAAERGKPWEWISKALVSLRRGFNVLLKGSYEEPERVKEKGTDVPYEDLLDYDDEMEVIRHLQQKYKKY